MLFGMDLISLPRENATIVKSVTRDQYTIINNNIGASNRIVDLQYHNDLYVAITDSGKLYYSFDLVVWDERETKQNNDLKTIFHDVGFSTDGAFIAAAARLQSTQHQLHTERPQSLLF